MNMYSVYHSEDGRIFFAVKNGNVFMSGNGGQTYRSTKHEPTHIRQAFIYSHLQLFIAVV